MASVASSTFSFSILGIMLSLGSHVVSAAEGSRSLEIEDVFQVWEARQARVESFRVAVSGSATHAKGSLFVMPFGNTERKGLFPSETMTFNLTRSYTVDLLQSCALTVEHHPVWHAPGGFFFEQDQTTATRKGKRTSLTGENELVPLTSLQGEIRSDWALAHSNHFLPITLFLVPFNDKFVEINWMQERSCRTVVRNGHDCLALKAVDSSFPSLNSGQEVERTFIVDPTKDMAVIQYVEVSGGKVFRQLDIEYDQKPEIGWMPIRWRQMYLGRSGKLIYQYDHDVQFVEINCELSPSTFDVEFPAGTWVKDEIAKQQFLVLRDSTHRPISESELRRGLTRAELLSSATKSESGGVFFTTMLATTILVAISVRSMVVRRRREPPE